MVLKAFCWNFYDSGWYVLADPICLGKQAINKFVGVLVIEIGCVVKLQMADH